MVEVEARDGAPIRVRWRGRVWLVQSVEASWCAQGRWWLQFARGHRRRYFRVILRGPRGEILCADLVSENAGGEDASWRLLRVWD